MLCTAAGCGGRSKEVLSNWGRSSPSNARIHTSADAQRDISSYLRKGEGQEGREGGGRGERGKMYITP